MTIAERLNDPIDPLYEDCSFEQLAIRAHELLRWRDELLLMDNDKWTPELEQTFDRVESQMLDLFYPWMALWIRGKQKRLAKVSNDMTKAQKKRTKRQERRERHLAAETESHNADARRAARTTLGLVWPRV